jgi:hypothetical protein
MPSLCISKYNPKGLMFAQSLGKVPHASSVDSSVLLLPEIGSVCVQAFFFYAAESFPTNPSRSTSAFSPTFVTKRFSMAMLRLNAHCA